MIIELLKRVSFIGYLSDISVSSSVTISGYIYLDEKPPLKIIPIQIEGTNRLIEKVEA